MVRHTMRRVMGKKLTGRCVICGRRVFSRRSIYCLRCHDFCRMMNRRGLNAAEVQIIWRYIRKYGFICYYTKRPLNLKNPRSPWYCVFDHRTPGDDSSIVPTCALVNEMKTDMTEKEFRYYIHQLDKCFRTGGEFIRKKLSLWYRLRPPQGK